MAPPEVRTGLAAGGARSRLKQAVTSLVALGCRCCANVACSPGALPSTACSCRSRHALLLGCPAELLCFLRDTVDTRKPPLMEVALDCIQKMVSFKLLQGPVHHINHRWAAGSDSPGPVTP